MSVVDLLNDMRDDAAAGMVPAQPDTPLRRCVDCEHHLGEALRAFCRCPMWGLPRSNLELRCERFEPKHTNSSGGAHSLAKGVDPAAPRSLDPASSRRGHSEARTPDRRRGPYLPPRTVS